MSQKESLLNCRILTLPKYAFCINRCGIFAINCLGEKTKRDGMMIGHLNVCFLICSSRPPIPKWKSLLRLKHIPIEKIISYTLNQWERLRGYIDFPFATPDNNLVKNVIRPFWTARKSWVIVRKSPFTGTGAIIYSILEATKANKLESYEYLRYLLKKLPFTQTLVDCKQLMPGNLTAEILKAVTKFSIVQNKEEGYFLYVAYVK
jgi:hypothetical protein